MSEKAASFAAESTESTESSLSSFISGRDRNNESLLLHCGCIHVYGYCSSVDCSISPYCRYNSRGISWLIKLNAWIGQ